MESQLMIVLLVNIFTPLVVSYSSGAPGSESVCTKMSPGHGAPPQQSIPPYKITIDQNQIRSGEQMKVTISGEPGQTFKGFLCQARDKSGVSSGPVGSFFTTHHEFNLKDCLGLRNSAATHKESSDKTYKELMWNSQGVKGEVYFVCTFVRDFDTYWRNVVGNPFTVL